MITAGLALSKFLQLFVSAYMSKNTNRRYTVFSAEQWCFFSEACYLFNKHLDMNNKLLYLMSQNMIMVSFKDWKYFIRLNVLGKIEVI